MSILFFCMSFLLVPATIFSMNGKKSSNILLTKSSKIPDRSNIVDVFWESHKDFFEYNEHLDSPNEIELFKDWLLVVKESKEQELQKHDSVGTTGNLSYAPNVISVKEMADKFVAKADTLKQDKINSLSFVCKLNISANLSKKLEGLDPAWDFEKIKSIQDKDDSKKDT